MSLLSKWLEVQFLRIRLIKEKVQKSLEIKVATLEKKIENVYDDDLELIETKFTKFNNVNNIKVFYKEYMPDNGTSVIIKITLELFYQDSIVSTEYRKYIQVFIDDGDKSDKVIIDYSGKEDIIYVNYYSNTGLLELAVEDDYSKIYSVHTIINRSKNLTLGNGEDIVEQKRPTILIYSGLLTEGTKFDIEYDLNPILRVEVFRFKAKNSDEIIKLNIPAIIDVGISSEKRTVSSSEIEVGKYKFIIHVSHDNSVAYIGFDVLYTIDVKISQIANGEIKDTRIIYPRTFLSKPWEEQN